MRVEMIQCDDPSCGSVGRPEGPDLPAYGWISLTGGFFGSGPSISVDCCSVECIEGAVEANLRRQALEEQEAMERAIEQTNAKILATPCPTCGVGAHHQCITNRGKPIAVSQSHATRKEAASRRDG